MRYLLIFLSFGLAHAATLTLSGSVCAGSVDTVSGAFTINCAPASTPPPVISTPPPSTISCAGYATKVIDLPWGALGSYYQVRTSGFGNDTIVVARFTTPTTLLPVPGTGSISAADLSGAVTERTAALSTAPCAFPSPNPLGAWVTRLSAGPNFTYLGSGTSPYYPTLQPATTYYFNIKNEITVNGVVTPTCLSGACDMVITLAKPLGW